MEDLKDKKAQAFDRLFSDALELEGLDDLAGMEHLPYARGETGSSGLSRADFQYLLGAHLESDQNHSH